MCPESGYAVLMFRDKHSVLVFLMFENVQNTQCPISRRSTELLEKVFLPGVIYFDLEMRFF